MIMYTQGATLDSGSTPDKPDVVSVPDVQESGTETKPDASSNNHLQFSYSVIHCYLSKSYPANLCKVPQNPLGPQNGLLQGWERGYPEWMYVQQKLDNLVLGFNLEKERAGILGVPWYSISLTQVSKG